MRFKLFVAALVAIVTASCAAPKKISYFQDLSESDLSAKIAPVEIKIQPMDQISIIVSCREPELAAIYNLPVSANRVGTRTQGFVENNNQGVCSYTVDTEGNIDFPVLGKMHVAGMTRGQIREFIKEKLVSSNELKNPVVTVEYVNLYFSIFGEVKSPGRYAVTKDAVSILDAIAMAGDLNITGKRPNIRVIRQDPCTHEFRSYTLDLTNSQSVFSSPVFYLQQNDQIYIEPNRMRAGQSTVNSNNVVSASFWLSIASFIATVTSLVIAASK